jgi:trans-aconitate 2-methyltransferase
MTWNPGQYLKFAAPRERPALDLLARVPSDDPGRVYDLGCGSGNTTRLLRQRWPKASITGVDSSPEMLAVARKADSESSAHSPLDYVQSDLATWLPDGPADLLYSNAALHWLGGHQMLFPKLMRALAPDGVLAVQMPTGQDQPRLAVLAELAARPRWRERLVPLLFPKVGPPAEYYDLLAPEARALDIWQTDYLHVLSGEDPVAEWSRGSSLGPLLAALDEKEGQAFYGEYAARMRAAYPKRPDGATLLPFPRIFIVAQR